MSKYQFKSESSVVNLKRDTVPTDTPNGFVVKGPSGKPVLVDYLDDGDSSQEGTEVEIKDKWIERFGNQIPGDVVVLVHSVKGRDEMLLKSLEINRLLKDGKPFSVRDAVIGGVFRQFVRAIREKYMEALNGKQPE